MLLQFPRRLCACGGGSIEDLHCSGEWLNYMYQVRRFGFFVVVVVFFLLRAKKCWKGI